MDLRCNLLDIRPPQRQERVRDFAATSYGSDVLAFDVKKAHVDRASRHFDRERPRQERRHLLASEFALVVLVRGNHKCGQALVPSGLQFLDPSVLGQIDGLFQKPVVAAPAAAHEHARNQRQQLLDR